MRLEGRNTKITLEGPFGRVHFRDYGGMTLRDVMAETKPAPAWPPPLEETLGITVSFGITISRRLAGRMVRTANRKRKAATRARHQNRRKP